MADKRISDLEELTEPNGAIEFVVNDAGVSKKITRANIFRADISGLDVDGDVTVAGDVTLTGEISAGDSTLAAIDEDIAGDAVDIFVYDTSQDSDGGAWRKRTQHTSWYNESLNSNTRGSSREFPAVAVIVAEDQQVTIYDADDSSLPMWMVFTPWVHSTAGSEWWRVGRSVTAISAKQGKLFIGNSFVSFIDDKFGAYRSVNGGIASPITVRGTETLDGSLPAIIDPNVNDIAITVLSTAPIDIATGIKTATVALATDGGVSIIGGIDIQTVGRAIAVDMDGDSLVLATGYAAYKHNTISTSADVVIGVAADSDIIIAENITAIAITGDEIDIIGSGTGLSTWATSAGTVNPVSIRVDSAGATIAWGDGDVETFVNGANLTKTYTNPVGNALSIVGDFITRIYCFSNELTGRIPDLSIDLTDFQCQNNQLTGAIPELSVNLTNFLCFENQLTGTIPDFSTNVNLTDFQCQNNQLTGWVVSTIPPSLTSFRANSNSLQEATVDAILQAFVNAGHVGTDLELQDNAPPSSAGQANADTLRLLGWTVTTD